tara:strand:+ start:921 stop:1496 length:576 start_codon:yes stop_codon:yes gene_type:complete
MSSLIEVCDSFLSEEILNRIQKELLALEVEDYKNIKSLLPWLPKEIIKEKNVIKYSEKVSGLEFSILSKETRCHIAIKSGLIAEDTQIHFDSKALLNIVVPIFMRDLKGSGLIIFPYFTSLLLRPILRYQIVSKLIRKIKFIQFILRAKNVQYYPNTGYLFKGYSLAHGVFYQPNSENSLRAVCTINFKNF